MNNSKKYKKERINSKNAISEWIKKLMNEWISELSNWGEKTCSVALLLDKYRLSF